MDSIDILKLLAAIASLAIAIIGHEIMHGLVAYAYGDDTAKKAGRLSINPIKHIDMVGTLIVPALMYFIPLLLGAGGGFLFGWAKPVPVDMQKVKNRGGYNGAMQVDLAGIFYNFTLATIASVVLITLDKPLTSDSELYIFTYIFVMQLVIINVVLGVFNLLPIPQFDGANFLSHLALKYNYKNIAEFFYKYEKYSFFIVLLVIATPIKEYVLFLPVKIILNLLSA